MKAFSCFCLSMFVAFPLLASQTQVQTPLMIRGEDPQLLEIMRMETELQDELESMRASQHSSDQIYVFAEATKKLSVADRLGLKLQSLLPVELAVLKLLQLSDLELVQAKRNSLLAQEQSALKSKAGEQAKRFRRLTQEELEEIAKNPAFTKEDITSIAPGNYTQEEMSLIKRGLKPSEVTGLHTLYLTGDDLQSLSIDQLNSSMLEKIKSIYLTPDEVALLKASLDLPKVKELGKGGRGQELDASALAVGTYPLSEKLVASLLEMPYTAGTEARKLYDEIHGWFEKNVAYQEKLNQFIVTKQAYVMQTARQEMFYRLGPKKDAPEFAALLKGAEEVYAAWEKEKNTIGYVDPRHQKERLYNFENYFHELRKISVQAKWRTSTKRRESRDETHPVFAPGLRFGLKAAQLVMIHIFTQKKAKVFNTVMRAMRKKAKYKGYPIRVEGGENLTRALPEGENAIRLIVPTHRTDVGDLFLLSQLPLKDGILFANAKVVASFVVPRLFASKGVMDWAGNLVADTNSIVSVGELRGSHNLAPTEKCLWSLQKGVSRNVINYMQGFVSNYNETLALNGSTGSKLVLPLLHAKYGIYFFPVTYEIESSFLKKPTAPLHKESIVKVHAPVPPDFMAFTMAFPKDMPRFFETMGRSFWIHNIKLYPELTIPEISERMGERLGFSL